MLEQNKIYHGDSFELDSKIDDKSIDLILEDMPYNTTACKWDVKIDLKQYWKSRLRIIKDNGAIVLTASQPFTSTLVMSNLKMFKCEWVWRKEQGQNIFHADKLPLKIHENLLIFYKNKITYNPQMIKSKPFKRNGLPEKAGIYGKRKKTIQPYLAIEKFPITIIELNTERGLHPTQKPVKLFEYLIRTYTNENDLVFDGFAGSGTTGVAATNCNRNFICIEKERKYFEIAEKRIKNAQAQLMLELH